MNTNRPGRTRFSLIVIAVVIGALLMPARAAFALAQVPLSGGNPRDFDARTGVVAPTSSQKSAANALGAVMWNKFGTPHSLIKYGGYLATGLGGATAADAARTWLNSHKSLFKLNSTDNSALELVSNLRIGNTKGYAVLFRQKFGGVIAAQEGMVTFGVVGTSGAWKIAYVSSTIAGSQAAPEAAQITPQQAWLAAAHDVGLNVDAGDIYKVHDELDWKAFNVAGFAQVQRARLRALPIPGDGVRPVFEVDVQKVQGATAIAYISFVDAVTKKVWLRVNAVDEAEQHADHEPAATANAPVTGFFAGSTLPSGCGPQHPIPTTAATQSIAVAATANVPADDIVLKLIRNGVTIVSQDTGTSPEAVFYSPAGGVPAGTYTAQVCAFVVGQVFPYTGFYAVSDQAVETLPYPPEWKHFKNTPKLDYSNTDNRIISCWEKTGDVLDCNQVLLNTAARAPWDFDPTTNAPSFTSVGNNAKTAEAWASPLTPSENYGPVTPTRQYYFPFTNQWYTSKCNPTSFTSPARNDIDAAIINLFVGHNRFHDFSYHLGFTEQAWNLQQSNFGNGQPGPYPGNENDPEIGNVQAGAITGGAPSYEGRDNANQITLQDGVPGITNQYLFQPIAGRFYAPCVDGSYDASIYGHEYTHAISNRMVGGPDSNLTGDQAGAMGESWSDLVALEYLDEYSIQPAGSVNEWAVGTYATGNKTVGIRNYALNDNPLNFSDIGYDSACNTNLVGPPLEPYCVSRSEVHSDGEIWNAVNFDIRRELVKKYDGAYPSSNSSLQKRCAEGKREAETCPGNRRWIQIVFDAFLLMPPDVTMLGARDAYLAADVMRFGGANQTQLWRAFARNGMGHTASTTSTDDFDPKPGWTSPKETPATVTFSAFNENGVAVKAKIYVGWFEAGITPTADTDPGTGLSNAWKVVPGHYTLIAVAPGYGALRFQRNVVAGNQTATLRFFSNWASQARGAVASGDGGNFQDLIDDTEATNWALIGATSVVGANVDVKLPAAKVIKMVQVSTMNHPADDDDDYDPEPQSRFASLYSFEIWTCRGTAANGQCGGTAGWVKVGTFINAFKATIPRPIMPNMNLRQFAVTQTTADHVRLVVLDNQCTGNPAFAGEQDNDPSNSTDCELHGGQAGNVRVAELQVFSEYPFVVPSHQ